MVQLHVGWDDKAPQPVTNPLVLECLGAVMGRKDVSIFLSKVPGVLGGRGIWVEGGRGSEGGG